MKYLVVILMSFISMGCNSSKNATAFQDSLTKIAEGSLHGAGEEGISEQRRIINSAEEWKDLQRKMNSVNKVSDRFNAVEVDFSKEVVVAVFDKVRSNGGYSIGITDVLEDGEEIKLIVEKSHADGMATTVMAQPYFLAKMDKPTRPVVFEDAG